MRLLRTSLRDFRSHERLDLDLGERVTVLAGSNGAGKTNILEAIHFGCTGRSCRTSSDRQVIRHGADVARVETHLEDNGSGHSLVVALERGGAKRMEVDGARVERISSSPHRPLITVFLPDRLSLLTGPPGNRRSHMDQLVAARRPALADLRTDYSQALMQRNSLVSRIRSGNAARSSIEPWDQRLAAIGADLAKSRSEAVAAIAGGAAVTASELGLEGELSIIHRPGCSLEQEAFLTELREGLDGDIERGFTVRGPHRDDLLIRRGGRDLKSHGSQGEKRLSVLSLLLAERDMIAEARGSVPLLLLDDVMSELDAERRGLLARRIESAGQCVVTATEFEHIPDLGETPIARVRVSSSGVTQLRAA